MNNTNNTKDGLVKFIMSVVKDYPEIQAETENPVVHFVTFMMPIDEITNALPGQHKVTFEKEMDSALFNYRRHFEPKNQFENEFFELYMSNRIKSVLSKVWSEMSNNSKSRFLAKLNKDVLNQIRIGYFNPYSNYRNVVDIRPSDNMMRRFTANRRLLMRDLIGQRQAIPLIKEAKEKEMKIIQTLLKSLKRKYPNGQIGQAMSSYKGHIKDAAKNKRKQEEINKARSVVKFKNVNKEGVVGKNFANYPYTSQDKPNYRIITGYRNNSGALYPSKKKNTVYAHQESKWRWPKTKTKKGQ